MAFRFSPFWWPVLAVTSPVIIPFVLTKNRDFRKNQVVADEINQQCLKKANPLDLPELDFLELKALSEWETETGFLGEPGVSYLLTTDQGAILFDVGYGLDHPTLSHNADKFGFSLDQVDAVVISHLHPDHMGGMAAMRSSQVTLPESLGAANGKPCFLPDRAEAQGFEPKVIQEPSMLSAGIATTGPLARSLFFPLGLTLEQAVLARIKGKGLVVITGCGHPTIELIVEIVGRISDEPIYGICGGLHFPVTRSRGRHAGIQIQMILGTGKPIWKTMNDEDLSNTIAFINKVAPEKVYLSAHDTCDHSLERFNSELGSETKVLKAGGTYRF